MLRTISERTERKVQINQRTESLLYIYIYIYIDQHILKEFRGFPHGVMVKAMDCGIVVREFVLQSRYYVHFRAKSLGKWMNPLILPAMG